MNENKNFCTKCECYFTQPGTCNCFAPAQTAPALPYVPYIPTYPPPYVVPGTWPNPYMPTWIGIGPNPNTTGGCLVGDPIPGVMIT